MSATTTQHGSVESASSPRSHRAFREIEHQGRTLSVPLRRVHLSNGETLDLYDTSGPQGHAARAGLPPLRGPWIEERLRSPCDDGNRTQLHYARAGIVTSEMAFAAAREGVEPEFVRAEIARG